MPEARPSPEEIVAMVGVRTLAVENARIKRERFLDDVALLMEAGWEKGPDGEGAPARISYKTPFLYFELEPGQGNNFVLALLVPGQGVKSASFDAPDEIHSYILEIEEKLSACFA